MRDRDTDTDTETDRERPTEKRQRQIQGNRQMNFLFLVPLLIRGLALVALGKSIFLSWHH